MSGESQKKFTVQQIELVRRLRNSGLTKKQVVLAYELLEQVDAELGNIYTVPVSLTRSNPFSKACVGAPQVKSTDGHAFQQQLHNLFQAAQRSCNTDGLGVHQHQSPNLAINGQSHNSEPPATHNSLVSGSSAVHVNRRFPTAKRPKDVKLEPEDSAGGFGHGTSTETNVCISAYNQESTKDVDEFLQKGTEQMHEEIREFLFSHPAFVHNEIATEAGVEVTSVSKFLIGNFSALPPAVLRQLCHWFLGARTQPQQNPQQRQQQQQQQCTVQTSKMLQGILQDRLNGNSCVPVDVGMEIKTGECIFGGVSTGEQEGLAVNFTPRRERFTFRKQHLEVLEAYFKTNQYPTFEERSDIAQRCNDIMEVVCGRGLGEKERMTPQNVAYWFSNRRKDIKRMAREGGIEMSDVVLPSKVKQTTSFSVLDKDRESLTPTWSVEAPVTSYCPPDMPSVGPVAFPTMVQRTASETNANIDTNSVCSDSQSDAVTVKMEVSDTEPFSKTASTSGPGSLVDRIATEISSQLLSKSNESASSTELTSSPQQSDNKGLDESSEVKTDATDAKQDNQ